MGNSSARKRVSERGREGNCVCNSGGQWYTDKTSRVKALHRNTLPWIAS